MCPHCNVSCRFVGEQQGTIKRYGKRMLLWTCVKCGSTLSQMVEPNDPIPEVVPETPPKHSSTRLSSPTM